MYKERTFFGVPEFLVLLIQDMDRDPFDLLLEMGEDAARAVASTYYFDGYEYEDFMQEARSVLYKCAQDFRFEYKKKFIPYYKMELTNHFNGLLKKKRTDKRKVNDDTVSLDELVEQSSGNLQGTAPLVTEPEGCTIANETLATYLLSLSALEKNSFGLSIKGHSPEKIAEELSYTPIQIRNALSRCRSKLKRNIDHLSEK